MATTNLISKSLGDILTQSGNGSPDHTAPSGSLYVDEDTGSLYINKNGVTAWEVLQTVSYGEGYYQDNAATTTISAANTWTSVGNTLTSGNNNGFSVSTNTLVLDAGRTGTYQISANVTIQRVAGSPQFEVGVSRNNASPIASAYNGASVNSTFTTANITVNFHVVLNGGDNIKLAVRNLSGTNNVIIKHAQLFATKIS